jgi:CheY-like chemotaxis protein
VQIKRSILIVDDDQLLCGAIQRLLEINGHVVSCCHNGSDAIKLSKEHHYDVVLTDYHMPGMKGDSVCRLLRCQNPSIFIVGCSSEQRHEDFLSAGADMFISKDDLFQNFCLLMGHGST